MNTANFETTTLFVGGVARLHKSTSRTLNCNVSKIQKIWNMSKQLIIRAGRNTIQHQKKTSAIEFGDVLTVA